MVLYPVVAIALHPEGPKPFTSRLVTLGLFAAGVSLAVAIARWAPTRVRGGAMLCVGFAGIAVTGGVVAKRVAAGIGVVEFFA